MPTASGCAFARAALAGNPSDGYGGATLAVVLRNYAAKVELSPADRLDVRPPNALIEAAVARFVRTGGDPAAAHVRVRWGTNVPRELGLGGSSALVTATLRALGELAGIEHAPAALADAALAVEVEDLGIAAGLQDRVAQSYGGLTFMDFGGGDRRYESLDPALLPTLFVAFLPHAGASSSLIHHDLRRRFDRGEPGLADAMDELAGLARGARDALVAGDVDAFAASLDATFYVRRRIVDLDPRHVALVDRARASGASANYAGSGGAIVGTWGPEPAAVRAGLRALGARCVGAAVV